MPKKSLGARNRHILAASFETPVRSDVEWRKTEMLLKALGAEVTEGRGSRVRVSLGGVRAVFHRPHPRKECGRGLVKKLRKYLREMGTI